VAHGSHDSPTPSEGIVQSGEVEIDETYFTSPKRLGDKRQSGVTKNKRAVIGSVERGGKVVARYVGAGANLLDAEFHIASHILPEAVIYSDEWQGYSQYAVKGRIHRRVRHTAKVYVDGEVHTQTIEGFWSLLKRGLSGAYHSVSAKHLQDYLNEYAFRYNHRSDDRPMFFAFLENVAKGWLDPLAPSPKAGAKPF
jgi:transposase-like protein